LSFGHIFVEYERLVGDAAHSPLVNERGMRDQVQIGLSVT
jgi:outer membrane scaffolding protein for murein synthesis (MipA/OmpV family)